MKFHDENIIIYLRGKESVECSQESAIDIVLNAQHIHRYDVLDKGNSNRLDLIDLSFPAYLAAVPHYKALLNDRELARKLEGASKILSTIPEDASILDLSNSLLSSVHQLFSKILGVEGGLSGFGAARTTKMLHKKRPNLIPIIDSLQLAACGFSNSNKAINLTDCMMVIAGHIEENNRALHTLKNEVKKEIGNDDFPELSILRLYDLLFWELSNNQS